MSAASDGGHGKIDDLRAASVELGEFFIGSGEDDPESFDFAEPSLALGLGDAVVQVDADLFQARLLRGVWPKE